MSLLRKLWRTCTDIRGEIPRGWNTLLSVLFMIFLLSCYVHVSRKQHAINPNDKTVPTITQIWVGVVNVIEPLKKWRNKWEIENAAGQMWPSYDNLVEGCSWMFALENVNERAQLGITKRIIVEDTKNSFKRLGFGLLYGMILGLLIGLHMGSFALVESTLLPSISLLTKIPPTAAMAIFFVLSQGDEALFRDIILFGIAPTIAMSIHLAVKDIQMELIYKSQTLGASKFEIVWRIIFPTILPKIIDGARLAIGPAMVFLIAAEMLVSDMGIGYRIRLEQRRPLMAIVYFYIAYLAVFGLFVDKALRTLQVWICPWTVKEDERGGPRVWTRKLRERFARTGLIPQQEK